MNEAGVQVIFNKDSCKMVQEAIVLARQASIDKLYLMSHFWRSSGPHKL